MTLIHTNVESLATEFQHHQSKLMRVRLPEVLNLLESTILFCLRHQCPVATSVLQYGVHDQVSIPYVWEPSPIKNFKFKSSHLIFDIWTWNI